MSLFESMSSCRVFYHTPMHIMSIFLFARENSIDISATEELALIFHDAIYRPGSTHSEELSAAFMKSVLTETGIPDSIINNASDMILSTKLHLQETV